MAKSYEPDAKRFRIILLVTLVFLSIMAVVIIKRKNKLMKEKHQTTERVTTIYKNI